MWWAYFDDKIVHKPSTAEFRLVGGKLSVGLSMAGSFSFDIPVTHPNYGEIASGVMGKGRIRVAQDGTEVFRGRVFSASADPLSGFCNVICEGELAELNDSVLAPYEFGGSPEDYLRMLLASHNAHCEPFMVGNVTAKDSNGFIARSNQSSSATWDEIAEKTFGSSTGGYLALRHEGKSRFIDWLDEPDVPGNQEVRFAKNLRSVKDSRTGDGFCTAIRPEGRDADGNAFTLESLPNGSPRNGVSLIDGYMVNDALFQEHGWISKTVVWEDVTLVENLASKAAEYASGLSLPRSVKVTAIDLKDAGYEFDRFSIGQRIRVVAPDIDARMLIVQLDYDLDNPTNNTIVFETIAVKASSGAVVWNDAKRQAQEAKYLSNRAHVQAEARSRTFTTTPTPPYDEGDIWVNSQASGGNDIYVCIRGREI